VHFTAVVTTEHWKSNLVVSEAILLSPEVAKTDGCIPFLRGCGRYFIRARLPTANTTGKLTESGCVARLDFDLPIWRSTAFITGSAAAAPPLWFSGALETASLSVRMFLYLYRTSTHRHQPLKR